MLYAGKQILGPVPKTTIQIKKGKCCPPVVLDVVGGHGGVGDAVVDDGVHAHSH